MEKPLTHMIRPDGQPLSLSEYEKSGGYAALKTVLRMSPEEVTQQVKDANLQGRGGAGFSTGTKWSFVPMGDDAPDTKYLIVNGDEMEPGTFKDRYYLEREPHLMLEGMSSFMHHVCCKNKPIPLQCSNTQHVISCPVKEVGSRHFISPTSLKRGSAETRPYSRVRFFCRAARPVTVVVATPPQAPINQIPIF